MNTPPEIRIDERRAGAERRLETERRLEMRRSAGERRRGRRRNSQADVPLDLRVSRDRRVELRRGMYDRRGRVFRRLADRRRETPAAYSQEDTRRIKMMMQQDAGVACPICFGRLPVERPASVGGTEIWEVRCSECNRMAIITKTAGRRVMVVDANPIVRDALSLVLRRAGHFVTEAADGTGASRLFDVDPPEVVVVDLDLPGGMAVGVVRKMAQVAPRTIFLVLANRGRFGAPDPAVAVKGLGQVMVVRKPFSPPAILEAMNKVSR